MKNHNPVIFYSWQSDHEETKQFIEKALRGAIDNLAENPDIELAPRFDRDTQGKVGSINIPTTIRKKIDQADVFVADISLIDEGKSGRAMVNQNVMYELGYATGKLTDEATVVLLNSDFADLKLLPFDIAQNRVVEFSLIKDKNGKQLRKRLESILKEHLEDIKTKLQDVEIESAKDKLVDAIENSKPARGLSEAYFTNLYKSMNDLYPGRAKYGEDQQDYYSRVIEAYESTLPLVNEFYEVMSLVSEHKKEDVLFVAFKKLEDLSRYFDHLPEDKGGLGDESKEYHGLIVYELASVLIGCVTKDKWWDILPTLLAIKFRRANKSDKLVGLHRLYHFPQGVESYIRKHNNLRGVFVLIEKRHESNDDLLQAYINGSLLMWFLVSNPFWMIYLLVDDDFSPHYQPEFIGQFKDYKFVKMLAQASDFKTTDEFEDYVWACINKSVTGWQSETMAEMFASEGIKTKEDIGSQGKQKLTLL